MFSYSTRYYVSPPIDQYLKFKNRCSLLGMPSKIGEAWWIRTSLSIFAQKALKLWKLLVKLNCMEYKYKQTDQLNYVTTAILLILIAGNQTHKTHNMTHSPPLYYSILIKAVMGASRVELYLELVSNWQEREVMSRPSYFQNSSPLTLSYSSEINGYLYHQRVSPPLKKTPWYV